MEKIIEKADAYDDGEADPCKLFDNISTIEEELPQRCLDEPSAHDREVDHELSETPFKLQTSKNMDSEDAELEKPVDEQQ